MSLLDQYLAYIEPLRGSAKFHVWSILSVASAMLERRVWLDRGRLGPTFPNLYTILVGPPSTGKGFAIEHATNLLRDLLYPIGSYPVRIGPTKITQAALYQELHDAERNIEIPGRLPIKQCPLFIIAPELAINMVDFGGGTLTNELIDFYDSKSLDDIVDKRIITGGLTRLYNPSLTILGGTTSSFLQQAAKEKLVTSGLSSRMVFVVEPERVQKQYDYIELDQAARKALQAVLQRMFLMRGHMAFDADAAAYYKSVAEAADAKCYDNKSEFLQNYFGRKAVNLSKVALVLAASEGRYKITQSDLIVAGELFEEIEPDMISAFGLRMIDKDDGASGWVLAMIPEEPAVITKNDLLRDLINNGMFMPDNGNYKAIVEGLKTSGTVTVSNSGGVEVYSRPKRR